MTGIVLAFKKYTYAGGIWGSAWNGFKNFDFFFKSGQALLVTKNTVLYNLVFIAVKYDHADRSRNFLNGDSQQALSQDHSVAYVPSIFHFMGYRRRYGIQHF